MEKGIVAMNALRTGFVALVALLGLWLAPACALAADKANALSTLADANATVEDIRADPNFTNHFSGYLDQARAVMIIPSFYKIGFLVGGSYGNAVLMVRDNSGVWSPPAFFQVAGGSFGLQIGGQSGHMLFMIMTKNGLEAILNDRFKVGANLGVTFLNGGAGVEAATTSNLNQDIIAFATASGAYGGAAIDGSAITVRYDWNTAMYGVNASPKAILFDRRYAMPESGNALVASLNQRLRPSPPAQQTTAPASGQPAAAVPPPANTGSVPQIQPQNAVPLNPSNDGQPTPITPLQKQPL